MQHSQEGSVSAGAGGAHSSARGEKTRVQREFHPALQLSWSPGRSGSLNTFPCKLEHKASAKGLAEPLNTRQLSGIAGCNHLKRQLHQKQRGREKPIHPPSQEPKREAVSAARAAHAFPGRTGPALFPARAWEAERAGELQKFITFHMTEGSVGTYQSLTRFPSLKTGKDHKNN